MNIDATYSPEDNKIRLYPSERLDAETFERVKAAGFKWAPRQELFVAPKWTAAREDLAIELAGSIEAEEMTVAERAEIKAERLEGIAHKRAAESNAYRSRASEISEQFAFGQPILVGHHSERRARKSQEKMHGADTKAAETWRAAEYWLYRAEGVERHANYKNNPRTRARRIKTLLADLRSLQRQVNEMRRKLSVWKMSDTEAHIRRCAGAGFCSMDLYSALDKGEIAPAELRERCIAGLEKLLAHDSYPRAIAHILNRLSYERELLGPVPRFTGKLTPVILQSFLREHGAEKPKATEIDADLFAVESPVALPAHIGDGATLELSGDEWRDLMHSCGYEVPDKKPAKPPILNFPSPTGFLRVKSRATYRGAEPFETMRVVEITKAEYSAIYNECRGVRYSDCGQYRVRWGRDPHDPKGGWRSGWVVFYITDQKAHPTPEQANFTAPEVAQ